MLTHAHNTSRAADGIVAEIEARILSGRLADGRPLPAERELMDEFSTSRTVIREAIAALASRGLVESKPRFRPVVRKPNYDTVLRTTGSVVRHMLADPNGVRNLYESRVFIERGLVRDAALAASKDDIARLKSALADNREAIPDSDAFYRTDTAFHGVLYTIPGNPIFPAVHLAYTSWLAPHWEKMQRSPERNQRNYEAHEAIYMAILERDPSAADAALVQHLNAAWEYVSTTFGL